MKNTARQQRVTKEGIIKLAITGSLTIYAIVMSFIIKLPIIAAIPMFLSSCGDVCLMKKRNCFYNKRESDFRYGVMFFMFAHIFYAINMQTKIHIYIVMLMFTLLIIYLVLVIVPRTNELNIIVPLYALILISSVVNTFFFSKVAFIGGLLFFISDSLIGIFMLAKKSGTLTQLAIWSTYVPAQILMITSLLLYYK